MSKRFSWIESMLFCSRNMRWVDRLRWLKCKKRPRIIIWPYKIRKSKWSSSSNSKFNVQGVPCRSYRVATSSLKRALGKFNREICSWNHRATRRKPFTNKNRQITIERWSNSRKDTAMSWRITLAWSNN